MLTHCATPASLAATAIDAFWAQCCEERRGVDGVGRAQSRARDQEASQRGAGDLTGVSAEGLEGGRRRQLLARHEPRHQRVERRPLQPAGGGHPGRHDEQHPHLRLGEQRVGDKHRAEQRCVGDQDQAAPVVRVGQRAADQRRDEQRRQLREPEQPDDERRASQLVHLERDRDVGDHSSPRTRRPGPCRAAGTRGGGAAGRFRAPPRARIGAMRSSGVASAARPSRSA